MASSPSTSSTSLAPWCDTLVRPKDAKRVSSCSQCEQVLAIMLLRCFSGGTMIPAFQLLSMTMARAARQLANFLMIMGLMLIVLSQMHALILGAAGR